MNRRGYGTFSSGYRLNKLGQVVSPQNGGNDLASIKLDKAKAAKLCASNCSSGVGCGFETAGDEVMFRNQNTTQEPEGLACLPPPLLAVAPSSIGFQQEPDH